MFTSEDAAIQRTAEENQARFALDAKIQLAEFGTGIPWPWQAMTEVLGPIQRGTNHYLVGVSGQGKSTLAISAALRWLEMGYTVVFGGFERDPGALCRYLAAAVAGFNPGDVLGGEWERDPEFTAKYAFMEQTLDEMQHRIGAWANLHLIEHNHISAEAIAEMGAIAKSYDKSGPGALAIVDHIDHMGADASYGASMSATHDIHSHGKQHRTRWVVMSQVNNKALNAGGNPFAKHKPLQTHVVKNGQHKEEVAWTMTGIYRPLHPATTTDQLKAVADDRTALADILWRGVTMLNVMKCRDHGERVGQRIPLGWAHGQIVDLPPDIAKEVESAKHRIHTGADRDY